MNSFVERLSLSGKRRVGAAEVYDLLQELLQDAHVRAEVGDRVADGQSQALGEQVRALQDLRQQVEQTRAAEMQEMARIQDGLAVVERGLQPIVERLDGELVAAITQVIQARFEIAENRTGERIEEIARRLELLDAFTRTARENDGDAADEVRQTARDERLEEIARQLELLDVFTRAARRSDRDQLDKVGTIAQGTDGFLRFAQADDRAQLDQIGSMSTYLQRDLNLLAEQQREGFERIDQALVALASAAPVVHEIHVAAARAPAPVPVLEPTPAPEPAPVPPPSLDSRRNLFVIGHARSGTSILLVALNTSPDIFLFGEANFHFHEHLTDFRGWYNQLQRSFGTPHTKSHYCPELFARPATCREYIREMGKHYHWVGEKVAFSAASEDYGFDSFSRHHESTFFDSRYVCVARHPYATIVSNSVMFKTVDIRPTIRSYVKTLMKIIELSSYHPNVRVLIHEAIDRTTFEKLGTFIDADLSHAIDCYANDKQGELSRDEAIEKFGERHSDMLKRIWLRFLEFYDAEAMVIRENEGRLPYVLLEYAEIVAAIDAELAEEKALAERAARDLEEAVRPTPPVRRKAAKAPPAPVNGEAKPEVAASGKALKVVKTSKVSKVAKSTAERAARDVEEAAKASPAHVNGKANDKVKAKASGAEPGAGTTDKIKPEVVPFGKAIKVSKAAKPTTDREAPDAEVVAKSYDEAKIQASFE